MLEARQGCNAEPSKHVRCGGLGRKKEVYASVHARDR